MNKYTEIIGAEIHVELNTASKMFCGCKNDPFGAGKPNIYTCPVCLGLPGALPVPNRKAIDWTIMIGLALNCKIAEVSKFDRKHYFYPDLPKGFQISQYDEPLCTGGYLDTSEGRVRITRVHLEEDTAKLKHAVINGNEVSLIDFNRSGVPLVEIVTEPDIKSASHAKEFLKKVRDIIRALKVSDADMEKGSMRLEANISLSTDGKLPDYKIEVKNINSFRFFAKSIDFEVSRLSKILDNGDRPKQETRGWRANTESTVPQRSKEEAQDYRYFPEPDIPILRFSEADIYRIKSTLPTLPDQSLQNLLDLGIRQDYATQIAVKSLATISLQKASQLFSTPDFQGKVSVDDYAKYLVNTKPELTSENYLNLPEEFARDQINKNEESLSDVNVIQKIVNTVIAANPSVVEEYKSGKDQALSFLMGLVMKETKGKADPRLASKLLRDLMS